MILSQSQLSRSMIAILSLLFLSAISSAQYPELFYFQLNEGTGSTTADLASPGFGVTNPPMTAKWDTGNHLLGTACMSDTGSGSVQTGATWTTNGGDFSIEFWYFDNGGVFRNILGDSTAQLFRIYSQLDGPGTLTLATNFSANKAVISRAAANQSWSHVAWVYESATGKMTTYLNGSQQGSFAHPAGLNISGTDFQLSGYISGSPNLFGEIDEFRFWGQARSAVDIANNMKSEIAPPPLGDDITCASIDSPTNAANCSIGNAAESVIFRVDNTGTNTIPIATNFSADLFVNGTNVATETFSFSNNLVSLASESFTFLTTLDLSAGGVYSIDVTVSYPLDQDATNDTASRVVNAGALDDMSLTSIDSPVDAVGCGLLSNTEVVTFTVTNLGTNTIGIGSFFTATLTNNGTVLATEPFVITAANINCSGSGVFSFATTIDMSAGGPQNLIVSLAYPGDANPNNDSGSLTVQASGPGVGGGTITTYPYLEDFDTFGSAGNGARTPINNGWSQDPNDGTGSASDWYFGTGTSSTNSGPETLGLGDHTSGSGRFGFAEDSSTANPMINLWSPCFDLTGVTNPAFRLWVNAHDYNGGTEFNAIHVDLLTPGGTVASVANVLADTGDQWVSIGAPLAAYLGQTIQFQIRGTNTNPSFHCDASIDDFSVFELATLIGQAPQAGIASLDINNATNANTSTVASGSNGPYATSISNGGIITMSMTSQAFSGILLLGAPLNVQVATYPGYGQLDIGNLPLNSLGIPGGLVMWADGITAPVTGFNQFFVASPSGNAFFQTSLPPMPLGTLTTFQTVNANTVLIVAFSNAVEVTIN